MCRILHIATSLSLLLFSSTTSAQQNYASEICGVKGYRSKLELIEIFERNTERYITYSSDQLNTNDTILIEQDCISPQQLLAYLTQDDMESRWYPDKIILFVKRDSPSKKSVDIYGAVLDANSNEKLLSATVYLPDEERGTLTNEFGYFNLQDIPVGSPVLISYVGYQPLLVNAENDTSFQVFQLTPSVELQSVEVLSDRIGKFEMLSNPDQLYIPSDPYNAGPFLGGEPDILKMIQNGSGVLSNEVISGPIVRGGSPDQNLVLLDGVPLYDYNHLLGFVSIFNSEVINRVDFYKGNFPARYGGRLSSVIDIRTKDGNKTDWNGNITLGLFAQKLQVDGPLDKRGRITFTGSGRLATLKPIINALPIEDLEGFSPEFWDGHLKLSADLTSKDRISFLIFRSQDKLNNSESSEENIAGINVSQLQTENLEWGNEVYSVKWRRRWNRKLFSNTTIFLTDFEFSSENFQSFTFEVPGDDIEESYDFFAYSNISDRGLSSDWNYEYNDRHRINFGTNFISHYFRPAMRRADRLFEDSEKDEIRSAERFNAIAASGYGDWTWKISENTNMVTGMRFSLFSTDGSKTYSEWLPRWSFVWEFLPNFTFNAGYSRTAQFIHLLGTPVVGYPTDLWVPSTSSIAPQRADQFFLNTSALLGDKYFVSLGAYYKRMSNLITFRDGISSITENWEDQVISGKGMARGLELNVEKNSGNWQWGVYYTLSQSLREFSEINEGKAFPFRFDRTHDLKLRLNYHLNRKAQIGIQWTLASGQPFTVGVLSFQPQGPPGIAYPPTVYFGARNNERMPWLHRLDFSIGITNKKGKVRQQWSAGLYNLYNRFNPFAVQVIPEEQSQQIIIKETSLYPILPFVTYKLSF